MHKLAELPKPKELLAYGERWRPYRSVASWYLWRAAEMKDLPLAGEQAKKDAATGAKASARKTSVAKKATASPSKAAKRGKKSSRTKRR